MICVQITFLILHHVSSMLVTLLEFTDAPVKFSYILALTLCFKLILPFRYPLFFIPEMCTISMSYMAHIICINLAWIF